MARLLGLGLDRPVGQQTGAEAGHGVGEQDEAEPEPEVKAVWKLTTARLGSGLRALTQGTTSQTAGRQTTTPASRNRRLPSATRRAAGRSA